MRTTSGPELLAGVCVSIGLADNVGCLDLQDGNVPSLGASEDFNGISIADNLIRFEHFIFDVGFRRPAGVPSWESFVEISLGMRICPSAPSKPEEYPCTTEPSLFLQGSIRVEISTTSSSVGGGLRQIGTYFNAFGTTLLHISDFFANIQFDPKTFPVPKEMNVGGQVCIGTEDNCKAANPDNTIRAGAFLGFSIAAPADNYAMVYVQKVTLGNILQAIGMTDYYEKLAPEIRNSGILPPITAPENCDEGYDLPASAEEAALGLPPLRLECVAYVAITSRKMDITGIDGSIEAGFTVAGRLLIQYGVLLDLSVIASFNPSPLSFKIDGYLTVKLPKDNPIAFITGNDPNTPAHLFVEVQTTPSLSLAVKIDAFLNIPTIKTSGNVEISLDSRRLIASGDLNVLGILKTSGSIQMDCKCFLCYFTLFILL